MTFVARSVSVRSLVLARLALILSACTESEGGANPIAVIGTVGGTSIVAMNDNDNLLFVDFSSSRIRPIILSGADLT
jgi:hypothetical protein